MVRSHAAQTPPIKTTGLRANVLKATLLLSVSACALIALDGAADAGGFAIREQSTFGQGTSFAGIAAAPAPSAMFWNPATMTQFAGMTSEWDFTGIWPRATNSPTTATAPLDPFLLALGGTDNIGTPALVPASYSTWQVMPNLWLGLSTNSPYGLAVTFPAAWAGRNYGLTSSAKSFTATPSVAVKITDWISVGAGVQVQWFQADLSKGVSIFGLPLTNTNLSGDGWGFGFTAGVTVTPTPTTMVGIGWRSAIDQKIDGTLAVPAFIAGSTPGAVSATIKLPDTVTASIRQRLSDQWTVMGTVEWTNWSRIGTTQVTRANGLPALVAGTAVTVPFEYRDGWFYSLGAEYQYDPRLALRAGVAYEVSPITDTVRTPTIPDNNRVWVSLGASYEVWRNLTFDIAYTHIFVQNTSINISAASGNPSFSPGSGTYIGGVDASIDIISFGIRAKLFDMGPRAIPTKG